MPSSYTPTPEFSEEYEFMVDADRPTAQLFRVPLERLADSIAAIDQRSPSFVSIREDFFGAIWTSGTSRLDGEFPWRTTQSGSPAVVGEGGGPKNPGQLVITLPGAPSESTFAFHVHSATDLPFSFSTIRYVCFVLKVNEDAGNVADSVSFGLGDDMSAPNGGNDSIIIFRNRAVDAGDWCIIRRNAGAQTTTTNVVAFQDDIFIVWEITREVLGDILIYANGVLVHTIAAASVPAGSCNIGLNALTTVADANTLEVTVDLVTARSIPNNNGNRAGA